MHLIFTLTILWGGLPCCDSGGATCSSKWSSFRDNKWYYCERNVGNTFKKTHTKNIVKMGPPQRPTLSLSILYIYIINICMYIYMYVRIYILCHISGLVYPLHWRPAWSAASLEECLWGQPLAEWLIHWCVLRREWMGCWGFLGWLLIVIVDHSHPFPAKHQ